MPSAPGGAWEAHRWRDQLNHRRCVERAARPRVRAAAIAHVPRAPCGARRGTGSNTPSRAPGTTLGSDGGELPGARLPRSAAAGGLMTVQRVRPCRGLSSTGDRHRFHIRARSRGRRGRPREARPEPGTAGTEDRLRVPCLDRPIYVRRHRLGRFGRAPKPLRNHPPMAWPSRAGART